MPPPRNSNCLRISTKFNKNFSGFTLAEVLITLGIIGIVAAITLPSVINDYKEKVNIARWKKTYSMFAQAYERVKLEVGGDEALQEILDKTTWQDSSEITNLFKKQVQMLECNKEISCNNNNFQNSYKTMSGETFYWQNLQWYNFKLKSGENLMGRSWGGGAVRWYIDVNGFKSGPNVLGKDLFSFYFNGKFITPGVAKFDNIFDIEKACTTEKYTNNLQGNYMFQSGVDISGIGCSSIYLLK